MTTLVWTYLLYLAISIAITVWVARTLHQGRFGPARARRNAPVQHLRLFEDAAQGDRGHWSGHRRPPSTRI